MLRTWVHPCCFILIRHLEECICDDKIMLSAEIEKAESIGIFMADTMIPPMIPPHTRSFEPTLALKSPCQYVEYFEGYAQVGHRRHL